MAEHVTIYEVGPRDGLQNEKVQISAGQKIKLVNLLSDCGFQKIEVTSFVSPKWVPQLSDASEVMAKIDRRSDTEYAVLAPNLRGYEAARSARADEVAIFAAASESFSQKNINCSIAESIERFQPVLRQAKSDGIPVRGYISCVTDCPYEGRIEPAAVARVADTLWNSGCVEISLGDTIGRGTPDTIADMIDAVLEVMPAEKIAGHYHDTSGRAIENIEVSLEKGIRVFDAAAGGLGGCPYAPGAAGNVATGAVISRLHALGYETGIDKDKLNTAEAFALGLRSGE